jgi:hypothetical protein
VERGCPVRALCVRNGKVKLMPEDDKQHVEKKAYTEPTLEKREELVEVAEGEPPAGVPTA